MLRFDIPGFRALQLEHLVLDFNGTLACDGKLIHGVAEQFVRLAQNLSIHVITADTHGNAVRQLASLPCQTLIIPAALQDQAKAGFLTQLGADQTVAVGNGRNDRLMLENAALGIAVIQSEGAACVAIQAADLVVNDILAAFELLSNPKRLIATLRN